MEIDMDAEQPARSQSVTAECEPAMVKEEPEWGECGVSAAAAAEGLYAGHEIKDELVIGPEVIRQPDIALSMQNVGSRMEDGPCKLKVEGGADAAPECTQTCPGDVPGCSRNTEQQHELSSCYVKQEQLPVGDLHSYSFGSEPESDDDGDEEDLGAPCVSRVFGVLMETPEDDEEPPSLQQTSPLPSSPCTATPSSPGTATPSSPGTATPSSPGTATPSSPGTATPSSPGTATPSSPESPVEPNDLFDFKWRSFPNPPIPSDMRREVFSDSNVGPTVPQADPYEIFVHMWDRRLMEHIALETNKYAQQLAEQTQSQQPSSRIWDWKDTSADELYVFLAILVAMGVLGKGDSVDYWSANTSMSMTPGFNLYMPLRRFELICDCLHFRDNKDMYALNLDRSEAKIFKIQPLLDHLNSVFQLSYNLQQNIALDESLLYWKGWLNIHQFVPDNTATVGIQTYEICEPQTGYLWRFAVHAHKRTKTAAPKPLQAFVSSLVLDLLKGLENKGHTVWMDSFYNSPALARKLKTLGFDCVGTLRTNRQFVPQELTDLSKRDMRPGQIASLTSGDVDLMVWRGQNRVAAISTYHGNGTVTSRGFTEPALIRDYSVMMGGLDKKDRKLAAFPFERQRTRVWYKKLFRRLLNVSVQNSYIICRYNNPEMSHHSFRDSLIESLLSHHAPHASSVPAALPLLRGESPPTIFTHHLVQLEFDPKIKGHKRRKCVVCKKRVTTECSGCGKTACLGACFVALH